MQLIINSLRPSSGNEYSLAGFYVQRRIQITQRGGGGGGGGGGRGI